MNSSEEIKVSIICLSYNHFHYIENALIGFLDQKCNFNFEIVVHDDASSDDSADVIKRYRDKYPDKFKIILQNTNQYSQNVNLPLSHCFSVAVGQYIAFCEGDDYWTDPYKLQKQVDFLDENPDYGLVFTDFDMLYQERGVIRTSCFKSNPKKFPLATTLDRFIFFRSYMAPCTWLMRRAYIYKPVPELVALDSTFCWLVDILSQTKIYFIDVSTSVYRVLEESASHSKSFSKMLQRESNILRCQEYYSHQFGLPKSIIDSIHLKHIDKTVHLNIALNNKESVDEARACFADLSLRSKILCLISYMPLSSSIVKCIYKYKHLFK